MKTSNARRSQARLILKDLLRCLKSLHADIFYEALAEEGFNDEERFRLVGSCIRVAASKSWMRKTNACLPSRRNHSNLQAVWISCLFESFSASGLQAELDICKAYAHWKQRGLPPPDELAARWAGNAVISALEV